jgi:predicted ArsR family transcriptional regulator
MSQATRKANAESRRAILDHLKVSDGLLAEELASLLGISAMGVRQHLYGLEAEGLVDYQEVPRPVGRPAKRWRLTSAADEFFPDGHQDLAVDLIASMREIFGDEGLGKLLEVRTKAQIESYRNALRGARTLEARLVSLARERTAEGYMAEVQPDGPNGFIFIENHCPVCSAARVCQGLCASELNVFRCVLGADLLVERTDHILAGARRCAYRVTPAKRS